MFMDMTSCQFGPRPAALPGTVPKDAYGHRFPAKAQLEALSPAMRREAALLAAEAGVAVPEGALPANVIALPHRPGAETAGDAWKEATSPARLLEMFARERLRYGKGKVLTAEALAAALFDWCEKRGERLPNDIAVGRFMADRWVKVGGDRSHKQKSWAGVTLTA